MIEYQTDQIDGSNILVVRLKGNPETKETQQMGYKFRSEAKLTTKKLILDFSKADVAKISVLDVHLWFKDYYDRLDRDLRMVPTALISNPKNEQLFKFLELSWGDQGIVTKPCQNQRLAINWLRELPTV